jgi:eukaryotic-like serine/threonine-protein kinase
VQTVGRYSLIQKLATGGMAEVFLARADGPMGFQKKLVVKRILPHLSDDPQFIEMFLQEAKLAAYLEHPNVVQVFDFGQAGNDYFLAMEYVDGANLRTLNAKARALLGPLEAALCARLVSMACEGLAYAHTLKAPDSGQLLNLVHRDISPDNILVSRTGAVKVADFGIARVETPHHRTKSGVLKGKLAYMPPEQLGRQTLDKRVDVYALGVVLYELLCGGMPFDATSEVSIIQAVMSAQPLTPVLDRRADVPHGLARIVSRALEKNRDERYPDTLSMKADLERFIQDTGRVIGASEIAAFFAELDAADKSSPQQIRTGPNPMGQLSDPEMALGRTHQSQPSQSSKDLGLVKTDLSGPVSNARLDQRIAQAEADGVIPPPRRTRTDELPKIPQSKTPLLILGAVGLMLAGAVLAFIFSGSTGATTVAAVDAGASVVELPLAVVDAGAAVVAPTPVADAGAALVAAPEPAVDAGAKAPNVPRPPARVAVPFRVRPWAEVIVDGKEVGTTPIEPVLLTVGKHTVVLKNPKFKTRTIELVVKPGVTVEHNFRE